MPWSKKILLSTSSTSLDVPTVSDIMPGRMAINTADNMLFFSTGTTIIPLYTVSIAGTANQISINSTNLTAPIISLASNAILPGTGSVKVPVGTTAQRPTGTLGMIRANSDLSVVEAFTGGTWNSLITSDVEVLDLVQVRRTTTYSVTSTNTALPFDTNDVVSGTNVAHSTTTNTAKITVALAGLYELSYGITVNSSASDALTVSMTASGVAVAGASAIIVFAKDQKPVYRKIFAYLAANDYVELFLVGTSAQTVQVNTIAMVKKV